MKRAIIFGTSDFAQIAYVYLRDDSDYQVAAFTVDRQFIVSTEQLGIPIVPFEDIERTHPPGDFAIFVGVGFSKLNANRRSVYEVCRAKGYALPTYVHSTVHRWPETTYGEACFIFENNVIQPFVSIGDNCVLWSGNHIGHHSRVGNNVFIASHVVVSGKCIIGDNTFVGVNATFRDGISVGSNCIVGAGAIMLKDAPDGTVFKTTATAPDQRQSSELKF